MKEISNIKEIDFNYILEYVKGQGKTDIKWLKEIAVKPVEPGKSGKPRKISFIEIRNAFVDKYMPHLRPVRKPRKPTMLEQIADL